MSAVPNPRKNLRTGVLARLAADANTSAYNVSIRTDVLPSDTFPLVSVLIGTAVKYIATGLDAYDVDVHIVAWTRAAKGQGDDDDADDIASNVEKAMTLTKVSVTDWSVILQEPRESDAITLERGGYVYHGVPTRYQFRLDYTP